MFTKCYFEFDRLQPIYYTGETVTGRIRLSTAKQKVVSEIYIEFHGEAQVHWQETQHNEHSRRRRRRDRQQESSPNECIKQYHGTEVYLHSKTVVLSGGQQLAAGTHSYAFNVPLPIQCPASCYEKYGKIEYKLSIHIVRPFHFNEHFHRSITVINQLDLNQYPEYIPPVRMEDIKYLCCWPCRSGPIISCLTIPHGAFIAGQQINFTIEIDNNSLTNDMKSIDYCLRQIFSFKAQRPHYKVRQHINTIGYVHSTELTRRLSKCIYEYKLTLPTVPPTSTGEGILTVSYILEAVIDTGSCHMNIKLEMPIVIGTVPLQQSLSQFERRRLKQIPTVPPAPPPPYEECVGSQKNDNHLNENTMDSSFATATAPELESDTSVLSANLPTAQTALLPSTSNKYSTFSS